MFYKCRCFGGRIPLEVWPRPPETAYKEALCCAGQSHSLSWRLLRGYLVFLELRPPLPGWPEYCSSFSWFFFLCRWLAGWYEELEPGLTGARFTSTAAKRRDHENSICHWSDTDYRGDHFAE